MAGRALLNELVDRSWVGISPGRAPLGFHRRLPGYQPTPLHHLSNLGQRPDAGEILVKDESARLGLPAFKILGASWATYREVCRRLEEEPQWSSVEELREHLRPLLPLRLVTATDGNHGRGVARVAKLFGCDAWVAVPAGTVESRIAGIESEGATVHVVDGSYDDAVAVAAEAQDERTLLIQDTSWPGYEDIPAWVIEGYSTMLHEIDDALTEASEPGPDLVVVQIGVGSLAAAVVTHYRRLDCTPRPRIVAVEPTSAACGLAACENDRIVTVPGPHQSIMAGMNCGTLASVAWPILRAGIDCFVAIDDDRAREAMGELAAYGIVSGESGAAGLGALLELSDKSASAELRQHLGVNQTTRVLVISTEGATDPIAYEQIVGCPPSSLSPFAPETL